MTAHEQASAWCHWLASRGVTLSQDEMRAMFVNGLRDVDRMDWLESDEGFCVVVAPPSRVLEQGHIKKRLTTQTLREAIDAAMVQKGNP